MTEIQNPKREYGFLEKSNDLILNSLFWSLNIVI